MNEIVKNYIEAYLKLVSKLVSVLDLNVLTFPFSRSLTSQQHFSMGDSVWENKYNPTLFELYYYFIYFSILSTYHNYYLLVIELTRSRAELFFFHSKRRMSNMSSGSLDGLSHQYFARPYIDC